MPVGEASRARIYKNSVLAGGMQFSAAAATCATTTIVLRAPPLGGLLQLFGHMTAHVGRRNVILGDQGHAAAIVLGVVLFLILPQVPAAALVLGTLRACKLPDLICLMTFPCQM